MWGAERARTASTATAQPGHHSPVCAAAAAALIAKLLPFCRSLWIVERPLKDISYASHQAQPQSGLYWVLCTGYPKSKIQEETQRADGWLSPLRVTPYAAVAEMGLVTPHKVLPRALAHQRDGQGCSQHPPPLQKVGSECLDEDLLQAGVQGTWVWAE